jgi:CubicO group peptidase (beta-lactamase class C family)
MNYEFLGEIVRRLSERSLNDFVQARIFEPLGMNSSFFVVPESARARVVKRPPHVPHVQHPLGLPGIDSREREQLSFASGGAFATAKDLAVFGQMFLNGGSYGSARVLSRPAIIAMTRNQILGASITWHESRYKAS